MTVNVIVLQQIRRNGAAQTVEIIDTPTAACATALGAPVDMVAQQARAFDELRKRLPFQIKKHELR